MIREGIFMYYDGTKLLSMKDINGATPEIYMCTTNRTGGKTTYFNRYAVNKHLKDNKKFCLVYRYNYELDDVATKFFKDIQQLFFNDYEMRDERKANGIYHELFIGKREDMDGKTGGKSCGYAVSLNNADAIKKYSHLLADVDFMIFDEFQSESSHYCNREIDKLISVHTSIARGRGKQVRYVPIYMLSNAVSLINPYYTELGVSDRLKADTKFLRGDGWVLESGFIESASEAQKTSGFNRAFSNNSYVEYSSQNVYLNDSTAFIEKMNGSSKYLATLKYNGKEYGVREFVEQGIVYVDDRPDTTYPMKIAITTQDHNVNYVMLKRNEMFVSNLRYYFERGCFRFRNLQCKAALLKAISY